MHVTQITRKNKQKFKLKIFFCVNNREGGEGIFVSYKNIFDLWTEKCGLNDAKGGKKHANALPLLLNSLIQGDSHIKKQKTGADSH